MQPIDYIRALRRDGGRIAAAGAGRLDGAVPSCPGWTMADLVWHVGNVHTFWRSVASGSVTGPDTYRAPARPENAALVDWFREGVEETADRLGRIDPLTPAWTWGSRRDVGFIQRRLAQETAVHCWDAVAAVGRHEPVERELAADGVDEFLGEVLPGMGKDLGGPAQTISLWATDLDRHWTVRAGDGACRATQPGAAVDAEVSAAASDLLLLLWGRNRIDQVRVDGDVEALERFLARATF